MATDQIDRVAVIGAGVMGSGIAAHLANARIDVELLDIVPDPDEGDDPDDPAFRNQIASSAIQKLKKQSPSPIFTDKAVELIRPGNTEDHLDRLGDVDWVIEAVPEVLDIKKDTFDKIEAHVADDAIISSNTSGLSVEAMLEGRSDDFKERFLVTHFFNPVRYMKLLEIVENPQTDPDVTDTIVEFGENTLGKGTVYGKDTTNFVANRIGVHSMQTIMHLMPEYDMTIEDTDQIFGKPLARPKSAVFRTGDMVGLDTLAHVAQNCYENLEDDEDREVFELPEFVATLVDKGWTGQKAGKGFYEKRDDGIYSIRPETMEYENRDKTSFDSLENAKGSYEDRVEALLKDGDDVAADFARDATFRSLAYSARRLGEIADDIVNIDRGMKWGFNWNLGPFETWDAVGLEWGASQMKDAGLDVPEWVETMIDNGVESFYRWNGATREYYDPDSQSYKPVPTSDKELSVGRLKRQEQNVISNDGGTLYDMGDGVACLEFHTKMNSIDNDVIEMMERSIDEVESNWRGLVIGNDDDDFSVGANLMLILGNARQQNWEPIEQMISRFQRVNQKLRYSSKPVVTAPQGKALGGGAEVTMAGNAVQAAAESYIGLVEVGVGLIPGGGGNLQLLRNIMSPFTDDSDFDPMKFIQKAFMQIGMGEVAKGAEDAQQRGFMTNNDGISMNADHRLYHAKQRVIGMAESGFQPPRKPKYRLPGDDGIATIDMLLYDYVQQHQASEHDRLIGRKLAKVLCGGESASVSKLTTEEEILEIEREVFMSLCGEDKSQERMEYMLKNNKPLRN